MDKPMFLAPMAEITHRAFRELINGFGGCDEYFSEMISAKGLLAGGPFEKWYIETGPSPEKLVFQLVGADCGSISRAAAFLDSLDCAGIDINMGCSAPLIRKTGAGIGWMTSIDRAGELISVVRPAVKRRLSVKLRIGFKDDFEYLAAFCRRLESEGIELITLHPRTATEKFKRRARWDYVGRLKSELKIPVAGNGDISCAQELAGRASPGDDSCDAVMVGRAAVRQPWIFAEAKEILTECTEDTENTEDTEDTEDTEKGEKYREALRELREPLCPSCEETGIRFLELLARYQPAEFHISRAMRFFGFFCDNLKWGHFVKNQLNREKTLSGMEKVWQKYFRENEE